MNKHTRGPWRTTRDHSGVLGIDGDRVCTVELKHEPHQNRPQVFHDERQRSNARLIAAAPALLDACRMALERLGRLGAEDNQEESGPCPACAAIRAALAAAGE